MSNRLFRQARESVAFASSVAKGSNKGDTNEAVMKAKNDLSSAFMNSTDAERAQLHDFQDKIDSIQS